MWRPMSENLWIDDIAQDTVIEFYGADVEGLMVYSDSGKLLHDDISTKCRGIYTEVAVGFLHSYKELNDYVQLMLIKDGRAIGLLMCYNRCVFNKESTEIIYDSANKALTVLPVYTGKGNVYFEVTDKCGTEHYATKLLKSGEPICVEGLQSFVEYQLRFYEKIKGLLSKKERELMTVNAKFYAKEDFARKYFKIDEVQYDQYVRGKLSRKTHYFNHVFVYFREQICDDVFRGGIVIKTTGGSFELYNINPVAIEMCGDVIDGKLDLAITKEGDGLLLDFKHHGIMNTLTDDKAVDIFSYTIDANGREIL